MEPFGSSDFLPWQVFDRITDIRISDPDRPLRAARARTRRPKLTANGRLSLLAADHPARRVTAVGQNPIAMSDRHDYLARVLRVLLSEAVDGVMATMDILEELLVIDDLLREAGGPSLLDGKLLIASLNRGGLANSIWEMDDPVSGPTPATCAAWSLDGAKMLLRLCDREPGSLNTLRECSRAVSECNALGLPMFLEPLPVTKAAESYKVVKTKEALARIAGVASALGDSSRYLWLKLPYCDGYESVARATTLPILLLGGESAGDATPFFREVVSGLAAGVNVRGALAGRNVLYSGAEDPLSVAESLGGMVHKRWPLEQALEFRARFQSRDMGLLAKYLH